MMSARPVLLLVLGVLLSGLAQRTSAQIVPVPEGSPLPGYARQIELPPSWGVDGPVNHLQLLNNGLPHVLVTGYWPPTNEIVRRFSQRAVQNPEGWVGANWENRGYNIYSFFPEFPNGVGQGVGDFEVDYQDTSEDWWPLLNAMKPIGLITFSRASNNQNWTVEGGNRTYVTPSWSADFTAPLRPEAGIPLIDLEPPLTERFTTLPANQIIQGILDEPALDDLVPHLSVIDNSRYLSNYIGYHGCWWHAMHADPTDPAYNAAAGHIHVGFVMSLEEAQLAALISIRALSTHLDTVLLNPRGDMDCNGVINGGDIASFVMALVDSPAYAAAHAGCFVRRADINADGAINAADMGAFIEMLVGE